jgi:hypothetical protein
MADAGTPDGLQGACQDVVMMRLIEGGGPPRVTRQPGPHRVGLSLTSEQTLALLRLATQLLQGERIGLARPFPDEATAASQAVTQLSVLLRMIAAREARSAFQVVEG